MNKEEIEDYNKLCAQFLNWKFSQNYEHFDSFYCSWESENSGIWYKEEDLIEITDSFELYYVKLNGYVLKNYNYSLKFDSDWNWIMEIVESINRTQNTKQNGDTTHSTLKKEIHWLLKTVNKEIVVKSIYSFLKFHFESKVITEIK